MNSTEKLQYGICFFFLYGLSLLLMVCCTQVMKYTIRRERPKPRPEVSRFANLRVKENGTFSMPSGDSSAAAVFCFLVAVQLELPAIYILMPLVMLGRVYYHCHYLGDTFVGLFVGSFWGIVGSSNFLALAPCFRQIVGGDSFQMQI